MQQLVSTGLLKPHPLNKTIYETLDPESVLYQEMLHSIQQNGILQALHVRPDYTILSGHRRWQIATALGLEEVPVEVKTNGDDRELLIEYNRYRRKTISEMMREAELLTTVLREKAERNRAGAGRPRDEGIPEDEKVTVRDVLADTLGVSTFQMHKLSKIWENKENPNVKQVLEKLDKGEISVDSAYKATRALREEPTPTGEVPEFIRHFTSWQFSENDPRFGMPHPGRIPGQIPANVIWYFTEPGDLVVDPMAGGGSTLDAAKFLDRAAIGYDLNPRRPDIEAWDISKGFPSPCQDAQLIFMDPPYWNMKDEGYVDGSSSRLSLEKFSDWYSTLLHNAAKTVRPGGFVASIIMAQFFRLPDDFHQGYIDWPMFTYKHMEMAGLLPWSRISVVYPVSLYAAFDMERAKKERYLLPNVGDIVIMRRPR
ncbi:chromosome partitioning protein parB [Caudoviricetes sp.]|nr:chromosome partitioning protein parB [Caudoviricetes sp.]